ncbi:pyridoxal phosphate-dependent transferase [Sporodiniella umbellata]|nr:pyridoxal phosphate-dependent transferase [Sporodiniella umbellata]
MHINLNKGQPSLDLLPIELYRQVSQQVFSEPDAAQDILQYGSDRGHPEFLNDLADFLMRQYGKYNLCVTPGASLSIQHILSILTRPQTQTRFAYFQDPTYFLVFKIFADVGYAQRQMVGIPDTTDGLDLDTLEAHLENNPVDPEVPRDPEIYDAVLYCVPTHANPTGSILSSSKRTRLVALARKYHLLVICDDVYDMLTYEGTAPLRTVAYDLDSQEKPVIISNCTFSKILSPGARVGWIEAHEKIIKKLGDW